MTMKRSLTKDELATREQIFLQNRDAMDQFASDKVSPRPASGTSADPLDAFAPEGFTDTLAPERVADAFDREGVAGAFAPGVFVRSMSSPVPLRSKSRMSAVVLTCLGVITAVSAFWFVERSTEQVPPPNIPSPSSELIAEANRSAPVPPPVAEDAAPPSAVAQETPSALPPVPEVEKDPPRPVVPASPRSESPPAVAARPPSREPASTARVSPPLSPPLSQTLSRGGDPPPSSQPGNDVPTAASSAITVSAAAPTATPVPPPAPALSPNPEPAAVSAVVASVPPSPSPLPAPSSTPPAASAPAAASAIESNTAGIQNTLARYRKAFSALDAGAARDVWPTVDEKTLNRAFQRLERQEVLFEGCKIDVNDTRAEAICHGIARYVPRVGSRTPRIDRRLWRFSLVKQRDEWMIGAVEAQ